jgi:hypothetical protein
MRAQRKSPVPFRNRASAPINDTIDHTGLTRNTIYREIAEGRIKSVLVNGRRLLDVPSVLKVLKEGDGTSAHALVPKSRHHALESEGPRR